MKNGGLGLSSLGKINSKWIKTKDLQAMVDSWRVIRRFHGHVEQYSTNMGHLDIYNPLEASPTATPVFGAPYGKLWDDAVEPPRCVGKG